MQNEMKLQMVKEFNYVVLRDRVNDVMLGRDEELKIHKTRSKSMT